MDNDKPDFIIIKSKNEKRNVKIIAKMKASIEKKKTIE